MNRKFPTLPVVREPKDINLLFESDGSDAPALVSRRSVSGGDHKFLVFSTFLISDTYVEKTCMMSIFYLKSAYQINI